GQLEGSTAGVLQPAGRRAIVGARRQNDEPRFEGANLIGAVRPAAGCGRAGAHRHVAAVHEHAGGGRLVLPAHHARHRAAASEAKRTRLVSGRAERHGTEPRPAAIPLIVVGAHAQLTGTEAAQTEAPVGARARLREAAALLELVAAGRAHHAG